MFKRSLLLAGLALACAAPIASADSIVFIDGGNVAVSQPDGSGLLQLTDGGGWHSPTQADDGTIAAVNSAHEIVVMAKDGQVLRRIKTPTDVKSGNGGTFSGVPQQLSFSPNGQRIAYAYSETNCPVASSCGSVQRSVLYTHVDSDQATPVETYGNQHSVSNPEWIDNDRALVFGGAYKHVNIDTLDAGDYNYAHWFSKDGTDLGDGELSRSGDRLALLEGYGASTKVRFYVGPPSEYPYFACNSGQTDPKFHDPSWSPDSQSIAFGSSEGVEILTFTKFAAQECEIASASTLVRKGASQPDWGPAEPATARYRPPADDVVKPPEQVKVPEQQPVAPPVPTVTPSGAKKQRFRGTVTVKCAASVAGVCEAVASVKAGGKKVRSKVARKQVAAGQTVALKLKFSKPAAAAIRKALRRGAKPKATVKLSIPGATAKHAITLTR